VEDGADITENENKGLKTAIKHKQSEMVMLLVNAGVNWKLIVKGEFPEVDREIKEVEDIWKKWWGDLSPEWRVMG
jgi:NADH:ubiquinone oxidoreductase subunit C